MRFTLSSSASLVSRLWPTPEHSQGPPTLQSVPVSLGWLRLICTRQGSNLQPCDPKSPDALSEKSFSQGSLGKESAPNCRFPLKLRRIKAVSRPLMARPLELEPYRLPSGRWQVNVIARLSPTGKRQRISFPSKQAALGHVEELKARRDNIAAVDRTLSPTQLLDAAAALDLCC